MVISWYIASYSLPVILECPSLFPGILLIPPGKHWPCWILIIHRIVSFPGQLTSWEHKLSLVIFLWSSHWTRLLKLACKWWIKQKRTRAGLAGSTNLTHFCEASFLSSSPLTSTTPVTSEVQRVIENPSCCSQNSFAWTPFIISSHQNTGIIPEE